MSDKLEGISVVIPTLDRRRDLAELLETLLNQSQMPLEVIIVDDSQKLSARTVADSFIPKFKSVDCTLKYLPGKGAGLPAARNLGIEIFRGDVLLFLDDDTLLPSSLLFAIETFLRKHPDAMGLQPQVISLNDLEGASMKKRDSAFYKASMLTYYRTDTLTVRRSGASIYPSSLTKTITAKRLSGCCFGFRREVFDKLKFDENLKRWGFMEDLDFSCRVSKMYPHSLYVISPVEIIHKASDQARLPTKNVVYMMTVYWFYVFFKDVFEGSLVNLFAFLWALAGNSILNLTGLILRNKTKNDRQGFVYLINSYFYALKHLRDIKRKNLDFFSVKLNE
jgi:glycosyltransferase involved in cell wall biosynthesis